MGILNKFLSYGRSSERDSQEIAKTFVIADCSSCSSCDGASATEKYPSSVSIDMDAPLWGSVKPWSTQILCATGKTDWVHSVTDEAGTLAHAIDESSSTWKPLIIDPATGKPNQHRVMISNSSLNPPDEYLEFDETSKDIENRPSRVLILPDFIYIDKITPKTASSDLETVFKTLGEARINATQDKNTLQKNINHPPEAPILAPLAKDTVASIPPLQSGNKIVASDSLAYIVLCSHRTRDKRCAVTANILKKKFETELREHDLYRDVSDDRPGGVPILLVSHVGGHKYAANCIIYTKSGKAIWLARVTPQHVNAIIEHCVLKGEVFPDLLRNAFNTNPVSW